jgi:hypothetical protein
MGEGMSMKNVVLTSCSVEARSAPRSFTTATASQVTPNGAACSERMLASLFAEIEHSCFGDEGHAPDQYAEFAHNYY